MNKRDARKYGKLLEAERARLRAGIRRLEEETLFQPASENTSDLSSLAEVGTDNFERETAFNIACNESEMLQEISDALERIEQGTYGICESCECAIPKQRLDVFPSARYCVECKSKLEKEGFLQ